MSKELEIKSIFRLIDKLKEMEEMGAAPKDIEQLQDDIGELQMNVLIGELFEED